MKKPKFASITKVVLAFGSVLFLLTFTLTTARMAPLVEDLKPAERLLTPRVT